MQGGKGDRQRYSEDKPDCAYCYFRKKKGICRLDKCYYLLPEEPEKMEGETCGTAHMGSIPPALASAC